MNDIKEVLDYMLAAVLAVPLFVLVVLTLLFSGDD